MILRIEALRGHVAHMSFPRTSPLVEFPLVEVVPKDKYEEAQEHRAEGESYTQSDFRWGWTIIAWGSGRWSWSGGGRLLLLSL